MKFGEQGLSSQYLKQAHDEWLYTQSVLENRKPSALTDRFSSKESVYSFHLQVTPDRQVHWLPA